MTQVNRNLKHIRSKCRLYKFLLGVVGSNTISYLHHSQAPQPGNIWHNRSGSIASCISCWTYEWIRTHQSLLQHKRISRSKNRLTDKWWKRITNIKVDIKSRNTQKYWGRPALVYVAGWILKTSLWKERDYLPMKTSHFTAFISIKLLLDTHESPCSILISFGFIQSTFKARLWIIIHFLQKEPQEFAWSSKELDIF